MLPNNNVNSLVPYSYIKQEFCPVVMKSQREIPKEMTYLITIPEVSGIKQDSKVNMLSLFSLLHD